MMLWWVVVCGGLIKKGTFPVKPPHRFEGVEKTVWMFSKLAMLYELRTSYVL